ncbi:Acyl-CoA reductase or other NAD-dependent aldehyde dehydrogenase [endosymbiont of Ridgeia piscesae]|jgi:acyl-CoA reductase-like NAD-dependent aldehyde dehydrogenase|uniref:Acyl-CoA reductase or other NAD-dependent aldehyde dehydrogenase n=4 Tax=endosymbiont of Ridgeia piscesae TaxID=54398 RepID=A0A0T5YUT9_9GAMM|nr:aldehyde dehydrogenase family protein [endosymbiont of Ridgeia piscesae]KRT54400.1 Acyl-CoA reductase or other NAD-dependent aldehyde dehydrogenase [endosymbiont of Ridgeia piscesae]
MPEIPHFSHLIAEQTPPAGQIEVLAPFDRTPIATVDTLDAAGVEQALATAETLFRNKDGWLPVWRRTEILERARQIMIGRAEELALEAAREGGKPLSDSRVEVARAIDGMQLCIETLRTEAGEEIPMGLTQASVGRLAFTRREPIGVMVALSAFNHPLNLIVHQAGPAVAAGCPVIVKPASDTPLSCLRFIQILHEAGLPKGWAQALLTEDQTTAGQLATDARVGFLSFIGSAKVGWWLRSQLAPGTRCALEHGGVAPVIVAADADLNDTIPLLAKGGFYHAGQVCVSVQRVFAEASIARELAERLKVQAQQMKVGDPTLAETAVGPLIRPAETQRIHEWVEEAVAAGTECLCGGEPLSETCYPATVLYDPPSQVRVSQQEVFGPVICVYPYTDMDEAIERANSLPYVFQAAVFTKNLDQAMRAYRRLDASAVMVNDFTAFRVDWMPFAGLRQSGLGVGGIPHTYRDMQVEKMMVVRSPEL